MLCCGDSENTESVLNAHNYIIKGCNLGAFVRFGAWRYARRTLISLISETMMGTLRAFHLMIKELLSEGEPRPCRYLIKLWSENWSHLLRLRRTRDKKVKRERKKEDGREKRCEAFEDIFGFNGSSLFWVCVCVCACYWGYTVLVAQSQLRLQWRQTETEALSCTWQAPLNVELYGTGRSAFGKKFGRWECRCMCMCCKQFMRDRVNCIEVLMFYKRLCVSHLWVCVCVDFFVPWILVALRYWITHVRHVISEEEQIMIDDPCCHCRL